MPRRRAVPHLVTARTKVLDTGATSGNASSTRSYGCARCRPISPEARAGISFPRLRTTTTRSRLARAASFDETAGVSEPLISVLIASGSPVMQESEAALSGSWPEPSASRGPTSHRARLDATSAYRARRVQTASTPTKPARDSGPPYLHVSGFDGPSLEDERHAKAQRPARGSSRAVSLKAPVAGAANGDQGADWICATQR